MQVEPCWVCIIFPLLPFSDFWSAARLWFLEASLSWLGYSSRSTNFFTISQYAEFCCNICMALVPTCLMGASEIGHPFYILKLKIYLFCCLQITLKTLEQKLNNGMSIQHVTCSPWVKINCFQTSTCKVQIQHIREKISRGKYVIECQMLDWEMPGVVWLVCFVKTKKNSIYFVTLALRLYFLISLT